MASAPDTLTKFAIEKGIPRPSGYNPRGGGPTYPFEKMVVGDSFFVPAKDEIDLHVMAKRLRSAAADSRLPWTKNGEKYSVRKLDGGIRVWRVA